MSSQFKKTIALTLLITIVGSTSFFIKPQKAEAAAASCLMSALGGLLGGLGDSLGSFGGFGGGQAVNVKDAATESNTAATKSNTKTDATANTGTNLGQCLLQVLARVAAQTIIHSFTQSTLNWINSGFHGSPSFVTNPEGFFADIGDIAAGQFIQGLGDVGQILCSPFDLNLRLSLGLSLGVGSRPQYQYVGCRLSDIQKNIYNTFVGGDWGGGSQGWQNFVSISQGSNNPYGAYLYGRDALSQQIASKVNTQAQKLNWGNGFLSSEKCTDANGNPVDANSVDPNDEYNYAGIDCEIVTPGSTIQDGLSNTLKIPGDVLSVSQDIDDILNALVNQGITQVFSATGLLGMSSHSAQYNGRTYLSQMVTTYQQQLDTGKVLPPTGVDCKLTYRVGDDKKVYVFNGHKDSSAPTNCIENTNDTQPKECFVLTALNIGTKTPAEFQTQITTGCQNLAAAAPAQNEISGLIGPGGALGGETGTVDPCATAQATIKNLTNGVPIYTHLPIRTDYAPATVIIDGNLGSGNSSSIKYELSILSYDNFFEIVLPDPSDLNYLQLAPYSAEDRFSDADVGLSGAQIYFYDHVPLNSEIGDSTYNVNTRKFSFAGSLKTITIATSPSGIKSSPGTTYNGNSPFYIGNGIQTTVLSDVETRPLNLKGIKAIVVNRPYSYRQFGITEFQAWGYDTANPNPNCPTGSGSPTYSSARITSQDLSGINIYQGQTFNNNSNMTISSSEELPALTIQTSLAEVVGIATTSVPISDVFGNNFTETRSLIYGQSNPEVLFGPATPGNDITVNASAPTSPSGTTAKTYYVFVGGKTLPAAPVGTYQLIIRVFETNTGLAVGTQSYTFSVLGTSQ